MKKDYTMYLCLGLSTVFKCGVTEPLTKTDWVHLLYEVTNLKDIGGKFFYDVDYIWYKPHMMADMF